MPKKDKQDEQGKKRSKRSKNKGGSPANDGSSIATHPRARASVRRIKAWVGLAAFVITAFLSAKASVPFVQTCLRALIAGLIGFLLAWWFSMLIWRQLILAEQRAAFEELQKQREESAASRAESRTPAKQA